MEQWIWIAIAGMGLVAILFFNRQLKVIFTVLRNGILGIAGILAFNMLLAHTGIAVGINLLTVFIVSVLGAPGFLLLYLTSWMVG